MSGIIVLLDVELADGARVRLLQPLVDALRMEEVQARHCAHFIARLVVAQANQARSQAFVLL